MGCLAVRSNEGSKKRKKGGLVGGGRESVKLSDPPQRTEGRAGAPPLAVPPVLPRTQEVLASPVIGVFVQHPVALQDICGGDVTGVETLVKVGAVFHQLQVLTRKVRALKDFHPVVPIILEKTQALGKNNSDLTPYTLGFESTRFKKDRT